MRYHGIASDSGYSDITFSKYVIKGKVEDEQGKGIWGIALMVGKAMVMSDDNGAFFVHVANTKPVPFAVAANASLQSQRWTLASAPTVAQGRSEGAADTIRVVVQIRHNKEIVQTGQLSR
jgi:hypothetical protein